MNYQYFASRMRELARSSNATIKALFHDDEKGIHVALIGDYKFTGNSSSKMITVIDRHGAKRMASV